VPVAAAWLLGYIAARLLDEVEDRDFTQENWGGLSQAEAINIASAFLVTIPFVLDRLQDARISADLKADFQQAALEIALGQHADLSGWIGNGDGAIERYWQVARAKSGVLFALACRAGARSGNPPAEILNAYADFGQTLGLLVQVCDDYRDFYGSSDLCTLQTGREVLPVVYGCSVAGPEEQVRIEHLLNQAQTDKYAAYQLRQLLDDLGARHYLLLQVELLGQQAEEFLQRTGAAAPEQLLKMIPRI